MLKHLANIFSFLQIIKICMKLIQMISISILIGISKMIHENVILKIYVSYLEASEPKSVNPVVFNVGLTHLGSKASIYILQI